MPSLDIFVRHGQTNANVQPAIYLRGEDNDIFLTQTGKNQMRNIYPRMRAMANSPTFRYPEIIESLRPILESPSPDNLEIRTSEHLRAIESANHFCSWFLDSERGEPTQHPELNEMQKVHGRPEANEGFHLHKFITDPMYRREGDWMSFSDMTNQSFSYLSSLNYDENKVRIHFTHEYRILSIMAAILYTIDTSQPVTPIMLDCMQRNIPNGGMLFVHPNVPPFIYS